MKQSPKNGVSKYLIWALAALLVIALIAVTVVYLKPSESSDQGVAVESTEASDEISYVAVAGKNALLQLKELNDSVVVKESELGEYVESINGLEGGTDGKYWSFYVDGELSSIGAGQFMPKGGEKIKWHFVKL